MRNFSINKAIPLILCLGILIFCFAEQAIAQSSNSRSDIKGYVKDADSGEALPFANIMIPGTKRGTTTNTDGYFVLVNVPVGPCSLSVYYMGYNPKMFVVENVAKSLPPLNIKLEPTVVEVDGVTVTANAEMLDATARVSQVSISPRQLSSLPSIGEVDVFRTLQLLPGISGVSDGSSGLYIRGGTPDQNLILFDGMTIYHVDHFFGFFSAFNADAIKDIQIYKGGFPAEYGGRISSVVDLTGKTGHKTKTRFGLGVNLLSANTVFEVPILKDKGTFLVAGRRSYTDFIQSPLYDSIYELMTGEEGGSVGGPMGRGGRRSGNQMNEQFKPAFYFYDLNSKLTITPTTRDIFTLSFYNGEDNLDKSQTFENTFQIRGTDTDASLETTDYTKWGNIGVSGKWSRQWHDRVNTELLAAYSKYFSEYDRDMNLSSLSLPTQQDTSNQRMSFANATKENNKVNDVSFKLNMTWQATQAHRLSGGVHFNEFDNNFTSMRDDSTTILAWKNKARLVSLFAQDTWRYKNLELIFGLRSSHYDQANKFYHEPRASLSYDITKKIKFKGAWGHYYQFVNRITNEDVTQGSRDFWLLSDDVIEPSFAEHRIVGLSYENDDWVVSVEGYQKDLDNILEFSRRFVSRQVGQYSNFFIGSGDAQGVEVLFQKKRGALTGWLGYTLGKIDYTFPELNNGDIFPADHDRRHEINIVTKYTMGVYTFAATWVFASGNAYTAPECQYYIDLLNGDQYSYIHVSEKNASRLPDYHRLDISASRLYESDDWQTEIGISIFNAYNHKNVWYRDYNLDTSPITVTDMLMLGFTPTLYIKLNLK